MGVKLVLMGHAGALVNPYTHEILKSFPVILLGAKSFKARVTDYLKAKSLYVINTDNLTWNPNE